MSENIAKVALPPYVEKPYEPTAALAFCRCREAVPLRRYLGVWVCAKCSRPIVQSEQ